MKGALIGLAIITLIGCFPHFLKKGGWKSIIACLIMCLFPAYAIYFNCADFYIFFFSVVYSYVVIFWAEGKYSSVSTIKQESIFRFWLAPAVFITNALIIVFGPILIYVKGGAVSFWLAKKLEIFFDTGPKPEYIKWGDFHFKVHHEVHYLREVEIDGYTIFEPGQINILEYVGANYFSSNFFHIHGFLLVLGCFLLVYLIFCGLGLLFKK